MKLLTRIAVVLASAVLSFAVPALAAGDAPEVRVADRLAEAPVLVHLIPSGSRYWIDPITIRVSAPLLLDDRDIH